MKKISNEKIVSFLKTHTWRDTAEHFKISEMTISRRLKRLKIIDVIDDTIYTNLLKRGFNRILKEPLGNMKAGELRLVYFLLTGKSISLKKTQYIKHIAKITGVNRYGKF